MKSKAFSQVFLSFIFFLLSLVFVHAKVFAVTVSISQFPSTITQDPFTLSASISGATNGTNYVRIDIYKEGTTNYFGETYNGTDWYSGSDYHQYLPVTISGGQWSGSVQGSLGSPSSSQYDGVGTYRIRIRRYTSGGTTNATEADNSSVVISIVVPTPTPTPTNTPTPNPTSPPTATSKPAPTSVPTLIKSSPTTTKQTSVPTNSQILAIATDSADATDDGFLSASDNESISITPIQKVAGAHTSFVPTLAIVIGGVMLIGCGILFFYKYKVQKDGKDNLDE